MNISTEKIDNLNMTVTVSLEAEDYSEKVNAAMKDYSKKANIKGFRKGMVPVGVIKKMYGKELLAEELNKLVNEHLGMYLKEEKIKILGDPMPKLDQLLQLDIDSSNTYDFTFELGLQPIFDLNLENKKLRLTKYKIKTDDKLIDEEIERLQKNFGKMSNPDTLEEDDILYVELSENMKNEGEEGIKHHASIPLSEFKPARLKKEIMAMKKGESKVINLLKSLDTDRATIAGKYLHVDEEKLESAGKEFTLKLENINRIEKAELNQEMIDKVYGPGNVVGEKEFRQKIGEELEAVLDNSSKRKLNTEIVGKMLDEIHMDLPEEFLKKWLMATNEQELTQEDLDNEFEPFLRNLKWSLIVNKIMETNEIQVSREEVESRTREMVKMEYGFDETDETGKKYLDELVGHVMTNQEHVKNTFDNIRDQKVFDYLQANLPMKTKEISFNEFKALK